MAPTLFMTDGSPPVRAVLITAKAIGLNLVKKEVNLFKGEHLSPDYIKLNPQHTVPVLVDDDGFIVWDSHAIIIYLISKYAKNDNLYPKDVKKRAIINQRLHFESGVVFAQLREIVKNNFLGIKTVLDEKDKESVSEIYALLEAFIGDNKWIAGESISIADYSLISSISTLHALIPIEPTIFPKLAAWVKKMEALPEYEANKKGLHIITKVLKRKLAKL